MKQAFCMGLALLGLIAMASRMVAEEDRPKAGGKVEQWRGLHLLGYNTDKDLEALGSQLPKLAELGLNVIVLEVDYHFQFNSHPKLRQGKAQVTPEGAAKFAADCRKHGIRLIPQFQCLGHQSWKEQTYPLLTVYPEFDLTPGAFPKNKGIYCREWDPLNPKVNEIVFKLVDDIIDGFKADAFHVGMDEVFLLGSEQSPSTKGKDPAKAFAKAVKDLHEHLVKDRKVEMLMWADRLFDAKKYNWGEWEAAKNGTAPALDMIPKDIILCPWHYEVKQSYPSIPLFIEKGFRVLPASYRKVEAVTALIRDSEKVQSPKMLGHLFTTWSRKTDPLVDYSPMVEGLKLLKSLNKAP
jgi:hypothetical protein